MNLGTFFHPSWLVLYEPFNSGDLLTTLASEGKFKHFVSSLKPKVEKEDAWDEINCVKCKLKVSKRNFFLQNVGLEVSEPL